MHRDAKTVLQLELKRRCEQNARYSLRAFAKSLGISHTALSLALSGKRPPSSELVNRISERLALSPKERRELLLQRMEREDEGAGASAQADRLELDQFELISEWYHYGVLSLLELPHARFEAKWIAKRLGVSETQAKLSMDLLKRMRLVEEVSKGRWKQSGGPIEVTNRVSTAATRKHHRQLLEKAAESLENDPIELRTLRAVTFVMDPKSIPHASARIRALQRELMQELESRGRPSEVYRLSVQLYPVTKVQKRSVNSTEKGESK